MQLSVRGKQLDVGDALRAHVGDGFSRILGKYFGDASSVVVADRTTEVPNLTVRAAVMHMDLGEWPALMLRDDLHDGLNMVCRRSDGNIGWIDPSRQFGPVVHTRTG